MEVAKFVAILPPLRHCILFITLFSRLTSGETSCYGNVGFPIEGPRVCDPTAQISNCCNPADICLSNGLCLNAGGNQMMGVLGCTDKEWRAPCHNYCNSTGTYLQRLYFSSKLSIRTRELTGAYSEPYGNLLFLCPPSSATAGPDFGRSGPWCCGPNATKCCADGNGIYIPVGQVITQRESLPSSTATTTTSGTSTPTSSSPSTTTSTSSQTSEPSKPSNKSLTIGLGVGIPLGVIFWVILAFGVWELRKLNNNRTAPTIEHGNRIKPIEDSHYGTRQELDTPDQIHEIAENRYPN